MITLKPVKSNETVQMEKCRFFLPFFVIKMGFNKELKYQRKSNKTIHKSPLIPKLGLIGPKC